MDYSTEYIFNMFQSMVLEEFGENITRVDKLHADASERNIFRIYTVNRSLIGVKNIYPDENSAFINFSGSFKKAGLNVPQVYSVSSDTQFYVEEDLGDMTLYKFTLKGSQKETADFFFKSLNGLQDFQIKGKDCIDFNYCYQTSEFSKELIYSDFQKFEDHYISKIKKSQVSNDLYSEVKEILSGINENTERDFFLYRDFQTRNIMIREGELYYIDYQSGRRGPLHYDVASFLYSGSINITEEERMILLDHYINSIVLKIDLNQEKFRFEFYYYALMRLIQILGSYGYTFEKKKDEKILMKVPKAIENIRSLKNKISEPKILKFIGILTE